MSLPPAPGTDLEAQLQQLGYVVAQQLPEEARWLFEPALYNSPAFQLRQRQGAAVSFYLLRLAGSEVAACQHWHLNRELAISQTSAPFGGPESEPGLPAPVLQLFVRLSLQRLAASGIRQAQVRLPAQGVAPQAALAARLLADVGFSEAESVANHHIEVSGPGYRSRLHPSARRRIQKCLRHGFTFQELPDSSAAGVYRFIRECRQAKGWSLSMTPEQLSQAMQIAPGRYLFFAVFDQDKMAAASIGVKVNSSTLYNYAPAHSRHYDSFSPVTLLTEGLYHWCLQQRISLLDLGTSAPNGKPSLPLITFKERLGGIYSPKLALHKMLD